MATPEIKFYIEEQHDLDSIFPPTDIRVYEEEGFEDWVDFFEPLNHFNCFPPIRQDSRKKVVDLFLKSRHGSKARVKDTPEGTKIYKRDVAPLLYASLGVYWQSFDYFTDEYKKLLNSIHSAKEIKNPADDWQK